MAFAQIRIDQQANPIPSGTPGRARDDILRSLAVTLRNGDPAGVKSYRWSLLHRPYGSLAVVNNPTSAVSTIVPDMHGAYRIRLEINQGGPGEFDVRTFYVRDKASMALPAMGEVGGESNYQLSPGILNTDGWTREMNSRQLRSIDNRDGPIVEMIPSTDTVTYEIDWGLPMAILECFEVESTASDDTNFTFTADAAGAIVLHDWLNVDAFTTGFHMLDVKALAGRYGTALEDNKVRLRVRNNGPDSTYRIHMRLKAP